jgi:hypothetical protein
MMNERVTKILNNPTIVPISIGVVAFGAGVGLGYILGRRNKVYVHTLPNQLEMDFNVDELAEMQEVVKKRSKRASVIPAQKVVDIPKYERGADGRYVKVIEEEPVLSQEIVDVPDDATVDDGKNFVAEKIKEAMTTTKEVVEDTIDKVVTHSIFANDDDDWNYAREVRKRTPDDPYVIHKDEFYSDEKGYTQSTLVYYAGDNILCDEDDTPVYNHDRVTGPLLFGHGSGDPNVVHIRNDSRKSEYEILYDPGLYSQDVLGLEIEDNQRVKGIEHSKNRQFRLE